MNVLERFLKYVSFDTASDGGSDTIPSTPGQTVFLDYLRQELEDIGLDRIRFSECGQLYAEVPATDPSKPAIGFIAHVDTVAPGKNVRPSIIRYEGGDIVHENGVVTPVKVFSFMEKYAGQDLIITDGSTVLGGDDKAGVAEIICAAEYLLSHPELSHGRIGVAFTPDEEIGRSSKGFDIKGFGMDYAYTLDGATLGNVEFENFNGASAAITINGINVHPGSAKNKMKSAVLIANEFISMLPAGEDPAHTEDHEGFYHIGAINGSVNKVTMGMILRDHDMAKLEHKIGVVNAIGAYLNVKYGEGTVEIVIKDGARNMRAAMEGKMHIVDRAIKAFEMAGVEPRVVPIRGGGDCNVLTLAGLPCPNLSTGGENFHGNHEFMPVPALQKMVDTVINIACM